MPSTPRGGPTLPTLADLHPAPPAPIALPARYEDLGLVAIGGMGEVRRVRDTLLGRVLAMKIISRGAAAAPDLRERFFAEVRVLARLVHPGVVAIHDHGVLDDDRPWFTMPLVEGRTLRALIAELHSAAQSTQEGLGLRGLLGCLEAACRAVAFAHGEGVVHRDLKPDNILVGRFGEVAVVDWGIARTGPEAGAAVLGTPATMSPEQARGEVDRVGPPTDVYALGAVLYELLSGQPPYPGGGLSTLQLVLRGPPPPIRARAPAAPAELCALVEAAMAREPADRLASAGLLADRLRAWLEGVQRRQEARAALARAAEQADAARRLRAEAADLREAAQSLLAGVAPADPVTRKLPGWRLESAAQSREAAAMEAELEHETVLRAALELDPELDAARSALAAHYRDQLARAERAADGPGAHRFTALLRAHDRGAHARWLQGDGALTLLTDPPGAAVRLFRIVERDRRLVPELAQELGPTPLWELPLPRGSWLLELWAPGCRPLRYPVCIGRSEHWHGRPPGLDRPLPIRLARDGELGPDDVYVPAGYCQLGGDPQAQDGLPPTRAWVDGFVLRRFPVTVAEYAAFLDARRQTDPDALRRWSPPEDPADAEGSRIFTVVDGAVRWRPIVRSQPWTGDMPVSHLNADCALACARWAAAVDGQPWRLVRAWEREKAARGVDGRPLPWGQHFEPTWATVLDGFADRPGPRPVGHRPEDESIYGLRDLCGGVRDLCANAWSRPGPQMNGSRIVEPDAESPPFREVRGGSWASASYLCHPAGRFAVPPGAWSTTAGLRLARDLPG